MTETCPTLEVLSDLDALAADDPRRRHLDGCVRCQSRLLDYQDFLAGEESVSAAELADAERHLRAALRDVAGDPGPAPAFPQLALLARPAWRAGLALAALVLLAVALGPLLRDVADDAGRHTLRLRARGESAPALQAHPARWTGDGDLVLDWTPLPGADAYAVRFLDAQLTPLARRPTGGDSSLTLRAAEIAALFGDAGDSAAYLVWQVEAQAGGDPLATSSPEAVALRSASHSPHE